MGHHLVFAVLCLISILYLPSSPRSWVGARALAVPLRGLRQRRRRGIGDSAPPHPALAPTLRLLPAGSTALLLLLCLQHSFPEPSALYLDLILATLAVELVCSLTCLLVYTGENDKEPVLIERPFTAGRIPT